MKSLKKALLIILIHSKNMRNWNSKNYAIRYKRVIKIKIFKILIIKVNLNISIYKRSKKLNRNSLSN